MIIRLDVKDTYHRGLKSLPPDRRKAANAALLKFVTDPGTQSLKFRPLKGRADHFIINPKRGDRIILRKEADDLYAVLDVGPHDNVYRRWDR